LIRTTEYEPGDFCIEFTDKGRAFAQQHGVAL